MIRIDPTSAKALVTQGKAGYIVSPRLAEALPIIHRKQTILETPDGFFLCDRKELRISRDKASGMLTITGCLISAESHSVGAFLLQELRAAGYPCYARVEGKATWLMTPRFSTDQDRFFEKAKAFTGGTGEEPNELRLDAGRQAVCRV